MTLTTATPGDGAAVPRDPPATDRGAQALEFALVLPWALLLLVALAAVAGVGVDAVRAQALAGQVARTAATDGDAAARALARSAGGGWLHSVVVIPPGARRSAGDLLTVEVRGRRTLPLPGRPSVTVHGRATARQEAR